MAISIVNGPVLSADNGSAGEQLSFTNVQQGHALLFMIVWNTSETLEDVDVTCSGETVEMAPAAYWSAGAVLTHVRFGCIKNIQSTGDKTVSFAWQSPVFAEAVGFEVSGQDTNTMLDGTASNSGTGTSATVSVNTTAENAFLLGNCASQGGEPVAGAGFNTIQTANMGYWNNSAYDHDAGAGTGARNIAFDTGDAFWYVAGAAFRAAGASSVSGTLGGGGSRSTEATDTAEIAGDAGTRVQRVTLLNESGAPLANLSGLKCYGWDTNTPAEIATELPVDYTASGTTDGNGELVFTRTNSTLVAGNIALMLVTNSDGSTAQSPAARSFFGPVQIENA